MGILYETSSSRSAASRKEGGEEESKSRPRDPLLVGGVGASIGLAGLILLKSQGEVLEGLVYGDTGLGDISAAALWGVGLFFCSPYQLLLLFLGKIETERPSDWILQKLGEATGQSTQDVGYTAPLPLQALTILFFIGAGTAASWLIHAGLGDATWSVSSGIGTCAAAGLYEVGRPERLSGQEAETLDAQWQEFAAWANERLQRSGQCHESEIFGSFRKQFARYRSPETLSDAALKDMVRNWHPNASRTANGYYKNVSVQAKVVQYLDVLSPWKANAGICSEPAPLPGEVHLWWLSVTELQGKDLTSASLLKALAPEDHEYAAAAQHPEVGQLRLLSRALQRSALARYCTDGVVGQELQFARQAQGKPELIRPRLGRPLHFNLTHTSSLIGLAVSSSHIVGLDVERTDRQPHHGVIRLAKHKFASREIAFLTGLDGASQVEAFNQLWTLKESFVKATGLGINGPPGLKDFSFQIQAAACDGISSSKLPEDHSNIQDTGFSGV
ncbi:hypothetical protein WJX84_011768 [Apatococcus fuscideae]|uniref:holo-[acyl-carrier-protein] synthase n=1 Tax=Apatococcus fuscideae TaxID=2026836 RepID=A0AAW1SMD9_9CHLO